MNSNKVHSKRTVLPFSLENKPGVSKDLRNDDADYPIIKLPPPPCPSEKSKVSLNTHDLQIPPPPCANFMQPRRSNSSRRSFRKNDDPFLIAYIECTKSTGRNDQKWRTGFSSRDDGGFGIKKNLSLFSCKHSRNVINDSIVKVSQFPISKSQKES